MDSKTDKKTAKISEELISVIFQHWIVIKTSTKITNVADIISMEPAVNWSQTWWMLLTIGVQIEGF